MSNKTLYCNTCGKLKPLSEFRGDSRLPNGHRDTCKECRNAGDRERYEETPKEKRDQIVDRTRARRASASTRSLNWDRVHQILVEAVLWHPTSQAQDLEACIDALRAGHASKPLPKGGMPAAVDAIIDIRATIRRTEGAEAACKVALAGERLDVIEHVLLPQAEAAVAWTQRQHTPRREQFEAKRALNALHAEQRVLEREVKHTHKLSSYTSAMSFLARELYKLGVR